MTTPNQPPTLAEIITAISALDASRAQARPDTGDADNRGVTKLIVGGVVVLIGFIMLGLFGWVGSSVNGLNTTVTKMSANVDQLQKSISDLQASQGSTASQLSDSKATNARQDARMDAHEADMNRIKERMRIVEGQPPLTGLVDNR